MGDPFIGWYKKQFDLSRKWAKAWKRAAKHLLSLYAIEKHERDITDEMLNDAWEASDKLRTENAALKAELASAKAVVEAARDMDHEHTYRLDNSCRVLRTGGLKDCNCELGIFRAKLAAYDARSKP